MPHKNLLSAIDRATFDFMGLLEDSGFDVEITNQKDIGILTRYEIHATVEAGTVDLDEELFPESIELILIIYYSGDKPKLHKFVATNSSSGEILQEFTKPNSDYFIEEIHSGLKQKFRYEI